MNQKIVPVLLVLLLAACSELSPAPSGTVELDPISLQATADALMLSAESLAQSAQEAEKRVRATERAANLQATRQAQAITATAQAVALQGTAQAGQATATAQALHAQAQATAQALSLMATATAKALAVHQAQARATATVQALLAQRQAEQAQMDRARVAAEIRLWLGLTFLFGMMVLLLYLLWQAGERYLNILLNRKLLVESRAGTLLLQPAGVQMGVMVITPARTVLTAGEDEEDEFESDLPAIPYRVNGELRGYLPRDDPRRKLALKLLRQGMRIAGANAKRLPGWRELGWSAQTWTEAVRLLSPYLQTAVGRNGGTYLVGRYTLRDLYLAVGERKVKLNPPTPNEAVENVRAHEWRTF